MRHRKSTAPVQLGDVRYQHHAVLKGDVPGRVKVSLQCCAPTDFKQLVDTVDSLYMVLISDFIASSNGDSDARVTLFENTI